MIECPVPNESDVTVESRGRTVTARAWSVDGMAVQQTRWVRYPTEEEADRIARDLEYADFNDIIRWYAAAPSGLDDPAESE